MPHDDIFQSSPDASTRLTRRGVLQRAGFAVAAAAFPRVSNAAAPRQQGEATYKPPAGPDQPIGEIMTRLSTYMSTARDHPLPAQALEQAKWHILDTIAAMVSGSELPAGARGDHVRPGVRG